METPLIEILQLLDLKIYLQQKDKTPGFLDFKEYAYKEQRIFILWSLEAGEYSW